MKRPFTRKSGIAARTTPSRNTRQRISGVGHMESLRTGTKRRMGRSEFAALKTEIRGERGDRCENCGKQTSELILDHTVPHSLGGSDSKRNLKLLCYVCDQRKPGSANRAGANYLHGKSRL